MTNELRLARMERYATGRTYEPVIAQRRNLGAAIFVAAIQDYRSMDEAAHEDAKQFLYAQTVEWQDHYDWAVALSEGFNPAWLREGLDRLKGKWDGNGWDAVFRKGEGGEMQFLQRRGNKPMGLSGTAPRLSAGLCELSTLLLSRRARRTLHGLVVLRRAHEHVLTAAGLEAAFGIRGPYYEAHMDALSILSIRAGWVARAL